MLRTWITIALRHILARKAYTAINVAGLAVGLACFILIALYVQHERSFDRGWANADRIYRISRDYFQTDRTTEAHPGGMAGPAAPLLKQDFPQIESIARVFCCGIGAKRPGGETFIEGGYAEADNALFAIFDFKWLRGDPSKALTEPSDIVLTRSTAEKYFGDADPMGKTLLVGGGAGGWIGKTVTGVIEDLPDTTHMRFTMLGSMASWTRGDAGSLRYFNNWDNNFFFTYALLRKGADVAALRAGSAAFFDRHLGQGASAYTGFTVTPITDIHLRSHRQSELESPGDVEPAGSLAAVRTFSAIAAFVLLLACINFTNLATAVSGRRGTEIGVRKMLGTGRAGLIAQFLTESVLLAAVAVVLALALVELVLPAFNGFLGQTLRVDYFAPRVAAALALLALATGIAAGSYPAFYVSAFQPAHVLRGAVTRGRRAAVLRNALVVLQFAISIALLVSTVLVYRQMRLVRGMDLGFSKDHVVVVEPNVSPQWDALKREWLANPRITSVTASDLVPFEPNPKTAEVRRDGAATGPRMPFFFVDYDFFETYGIELLAGRTFSREHGDRAGPANATGESGAARGRPFVVNELAARQLGFTPEQAVGKWIDFGRVQGARFKTDDAAGPIIGVVDNARFESAYHRVAPSVYMSTGAHLAAVSLRVTGRNLEDTLAYIDDEWKRFNRDVPIDRQLLDQRFEALYLNETREEDLLELFSMLSAVIACLGVLGLVALATERRTKEIGVRKVLGGTLFDIVRMFTAEFTLLVLAANVIAWPVAYLFMHRWLAPFAYRIGMSPWVFAAGTLAVLALTWLTVGAVALRAAGAKPSRSLRYE